MNLKIAVAVYSKKNWTFFNLTLYDMQLKNIENHRTKGNLSSHWMKPEATN
jgi:hypothetical protein